MASSALPHLIYPICMSTNPLQFQLNAALRSAICFVFAMKLKYFPTACDWLSPLQKDWNYICVALEIFDVYSILTGATCYIASILQKLKTWEAEYIWIIYIGCHRLAWFQRTWPIILPLFAGGDETFQIGCFSWFLRGEKHHVNLMCPDPRRYTSTEKDACPHLCNHIGRSIGHTSPVPHFRASLSFHSPSLHIKQHKWLNLHDRICNMANQVSDSIKHYTGTLS